MKQEYDLISVLDYQTNPYYKDNPENFIALIDLVSKNRTQYYHSLTASYRGYKCKNKPYKLRQQPPYRYLGIWIENLLPILSNPVIKMSTKVKWILEGITEFPKCSVCGKTDYYKTYNVSFGYNYPRTCSIICQNNDPIRLHNIIQNNRKTYGYDWPKQNPEIQLRDELKLVETYGVKNVFQLEDIKEKSKITSVKNYNNPNWKNTEQMLKTKQAFTDEQKENRLKSFNNSCLKSLGVCFPTQSLDIQEKIALTYFNNTGYSHPMHNPDVRKKCSYRYTFNNENFDSSNELAFFIYARDNNLPIKHLTDVRLKYYFNDKLHYYYPDFINFKTNQYIEIKGPQFFDNTGKMICPYKYPNWTDEQYKNRCDKEEAKHQCMLNANVNIILTNSKYMKDILTYISKKYTLSYLDQFRNKPKTEKA